MDVLFKDTKLIDYIKSIDENKGSNKDYKKHIGLFLEFKAREKGIPLSGSFELTPFCNLDCKMCYVHLNNSQYRHKDLLSVEVWKNLISQAYNAGMRKASLTGGECLTYPGFNDVYLFLYNLGIVPGILSNGILIDNNRLEFFKKFPPKRIQITLYGSSDDAYERVTGHRVFKIVYNNIINIRNEGIPVKLAITPNRFMEDDIDLLLNTAERLNIPYYINSSLIIPRDNTGRRKEDLSLDYYIKLYKKKNEINCIGIHSIDLAELPEQSHTESKRVGLLCGAGRSSFAITYDGMMCPCTSFNEISSNSLELGVKGAWDVINKIANNHLLPLECGECYYKNVCFQCAALHKEAAFKGHCNPQICDRTKRLISEGLLSKPED